MTQAAGGGRRLFAAAAAGWQIQLALGVARPPRRFANREAPLLRVATFRGPSNGGGGEGGAARHNRSLESRAATSRRR